MRIYTDNTCIHGLDCVYWSSSIRKWNWQVQIQHKHACEQYGYGYAYHTGRG